MARRSASTLILLSLGVFVALGCGSDKPEYCSKADDLQEAVGTLKSDVSSGNVSAIRSDLNSVNADADAVAGAAESEFPSESKAIRSSVSRLARTIDALPSSPSASDVVGLASGVNEVASAIDNFKSATSSECD
jgi:hypothetical protein